ncbi:mannobiose 2-epimerase [Halanaerobium saccharolyticum]|uniref:Cellobiose 2-epimerase n=1 Tax=Halanaerobium saccharolyticum TaxID=43595 RepID=A0A4R7Z5B4_9FIRM|nr:AGE family epimerase/isomerase [Halanaerobium saccharolyticum]RAK07883.1 mannobiose 2-epimerase [Halanaerobium saccharolyticum]TDW04497.1 mannobiose 2-epimerase [Halanaerobium saccharolyticum]TDX59833.1 mannobiose 2-epimerase [Halanaerobium saccharolyticum]
MKKNLLEEFADSVTKEKDNLLTFWLNNSIDKDYGGFYGEVSVSNKAQTKADKALILNSRILWSFANAYREDKNPDYLKMADRAYDYLLANFEDKKYGGFYWLLNYLGKVKENKKQIYGQAFCIYAFSEYYRATDNEDALKKAVDLFALIEDRSYDPEYRGYFEAYNRDWSAADDMSLSEKDMNVAKSMNTHLHILEAYTNLYRVWPDPGLESKLKELIEVVLNNIVDQNQFRFKLFFDQDWTSKSEIVSYGHDIEGSWLLYEAAEVLGEQVVLDIAEDYALKMAAQVLKEGTAEDGSIYYEFESGKLDKDRHWWPQAEAVVGFINAYQLSGEEDFIQAASKGWDYIVKNIVDQENGGWYWLVSEQGKAASKAKINAWKSPYHSSRACYEIINRIEQILV